LELRLPIFVLALLVKPASLELEAFRFKIPSWLLSLLLPSTAILFSPLRVSLIALDQFGLREPDDMGIAGDHVRGGALHLFEPGVPPVVDTVHIGHHMRPRSPASAGFCAP
jgi:hypothetical protein